MTEAVILTLIALCGTMLLPIVSIVLVKMMLKSKPSHFKFQTVYGQIEVDFDHKADE